MILKPDPFKITRELEAAICEYTGAPYCVTTTSCTMALLIAVKWWVKQWNVSSYPQILHQVIVSIPRRTYVGVPQSIINAGARVEFRDQVWTGQYWLDPLPIADAARRFQLDMYVGYERGVMLCCSFHTSKILADTQGGCILHDNPEFDAWARRMRFDGRTEGVPAKEDEITEVGYHAYLSPDVSARLLWKLSHLGEGWVLPTDDYPDLSKMSAFR